MSLNNLTRHEASERAGLISGPAYLVSLDLLDADAETFGCMTEIVFDCSSPGSESFVEYFAPVVTSIELNGRPVGLEAFDGHRIRLTGLEKNNVLKVKGRSAFQHDGVGMHRFVDPVDGAVYCHTDAEPYDIHRVYPCFDQPDLKGTFEFSVRAAAGWHVSSNGPATHVPDPATGGWWQFARTPKMSTYITAVVAGNFHVVNDRHGAIDLALLCRQSLARYLDAEEIFDITKRGFDFFAEEFAYPYVFGKYDQAFCPEFNAGAMENAGLVTFSERHIFRSRVTEATREARADTILHEMAHMWFGDLVTMRWWDDLWLNESFATYMSLVALVRATRFTSAFTTFSADWKTWAYRQDQLPSTHPIVADMPDIESVKVNFDGITYAKGASVLRQLVAWVGEEAFTAGVRNYFRQHAFGNTTLDDFLKALAESSGRDLQAWSKEWLETAGVNTLRPVASIEEGRFRSFAILQEAPPDYPTLRSHRLAVGLYDDSGDGDGRLVRRRRLELDVVGRETEVPELAGDAVPELVLLNDVDLTYAKIRLDDASFATLTRRLKDLSDSLPRALSWAATWDMVRDAELATRAYVRLVLGNVDGETQVAVAETLLSQAGSAVHFYGDPANHDAALDSLATAAWEHLGAAAPGSDHQLAWARAFAGFARSAEHVAAVRGLLDATVTVEGLVMDTELRWTFVRYLAAAGAADEALIEEELRRDPTDAGARHAAAARAAMPTPEAKAAAWEQILDPSVTFATMRALMGGFQQPDQEPLLEPYAAKYFEQIGPMFETRSLEVAIGFTNGMYPRMLVREDIVAMTDDYIATFNPPAPAQRLLREGKDAIQRSLRARACDIAAAG
ncbi:MAG: aminopeptidase [Actinobacteria bacterium]|nr:aminopeptidase [Actinomycetota bacterium]